MESELKLGTNAQLATNSISQNQILRLVSIKLLVLLKIENIELKIGFNFVIRNTCGLIKTNHRFNVPFVAKDTQERIDCKFTFEKCIV